MNKSPPPIPSQNFNSNKMGQYQKLPPNHPGTNVQPPMGM
jgi:hypothetical protein